MTAYLVYFSVFAVAVLLTSFVGNRLASGAAVQSSINRRMLILEKSGDGLKGLMDVRLERGLRGDGTLGNAFRSIQEQYVQSGVVVGWKVLVLYFAVAAVIVGFAATRMLDSQLIGIAIGLAVLGIGPFAYLSRRRSARLTAFSKQLPDTIDVIVRSLQAGHPLTTSLTLVASEMPDPIGSEFGMLNDEITYGTEMDRALQNLMMRAPVEELGMFSTTIMIQRQTGGNLAEILQTLSTTIRERQMLKMKIRSLTSEGRFSAIFMTMFPFLMYGVIRALSPTYFDKLWESGYGNYVFGGCLITILIGNYIMRRMVNFKV